MTKKNITTLVVIVIVIVLIFMVFAKVKYQKNNKQLPLTPSEIEINKAATENTTQDIKTSIDSININDTGLDEDLKSVDSELEKL